MTEIEEGNVIIAKWNGIEVLEGINYDNVKYYYYDNPIVQGYDALPDYSNDWNALMEVVKKIEDMDIPFDDFSVEICGYVCIVHGYHNRFEETSNDSKIEATWLAVVSFIKWLNSLHNENT